MKTKALTQSSGESEVKRILEERLAPTPYQVWGKVRLASVIGLQPRERIADKLFEYLRGAELDYVILQRSHRNFPLLAVEFDGPHHESDAGAIQRDLLKNRLCQMAKLPLLRVRYSEIEPFFTRDTFLSFLVEIIVKYKVSDEPKKYPPPRSPGAFSEAEYDELRRHDLKDVDRLENKLARNYGIYRSGHAPGASFDFIFSPGASYSTEDGSIDEGSLILRRALPAQAEETWPSLHRISKRVTLRTHYRTTAAPRPPLPSSLSDPRAFEEYVNWLNTEPLYAPDLPGVNWFYVAWSVLEVLCLGQLLRDVEAGLVQRLAGSPH